MRLRPVLIWGAVSLALCVPLALAATSPLLAWRQPIYILAGFAGILAMGLLLVQPLLVRGALPGVPGRRVHRWVGVGLIAAVLAHVGGLWIFSPPDVVDALLFASPTPFSLWGVIAMWAVFAAALLAMLRKRAGLRPMLWRQIHTVFAVITVVGTVLHVLLIEGTMEPVSKVVLSLLVLGVLAKAVVDLRIWRLRKTQGLR